MLAFHDVTDAAAFEGQMRHLVKHYEPVSGRMVAAALHGDVPLPPNAVWVTFDDGHPSVVRCGQPVLDQLGVPATLFICPGVIDTDRPFWWTVVQTAIDRGVHVEVDGVPWSDAALITHLKGRQDSERRRTVSYLQAELQRRHGGVTGEQLQRSQLRQWLSAGHEVGNHTWDHPCLDRCEPKEQMDQLRRADDWLRTNVPGFSPFFAYPNGNWSPVVDEALRTSGYTLAVGFDHRLDRLTDPLRVSRLRVSADASLQRFTAIVSGLHPAAFQALPRDRGRDPSGSPTLDSPPAGAGARW